MSWLRLVCVSGLQTSRQPIAQQLLHAQQLLCTQVAGSLQPAATGGLSDPAICACLVLRVHQNVLSPERQPCLRPQVQTQLSVGRANAFAQGD